MRPRTKNYKITHERKRWSHAKKFRAHEIPTRKKFEPTKYSQEKIWDTRNAYEKIFWTREIPTRKYSGPTRKYFGPTKYLRRHDSTRPTRPTMACDPRNLAHSCLYKEQPLHSKNPHLSPNIFWIWQLFLFCIYVPFLKAANGSVVKTISFWRSLNPSYQGMNL